MQNAVMLGWIAAQSRRAALDSAGSRIGQILGENAAGGYDVQFSDGQAVSNVHSQQTTQWKAGQWVTLNRVSGVWLIVGSGAARG